MGSEPTVTASVDSESKEDVIDHKIMPANDLCKRNCQCIHFKIKSQRMEIAEREEIVLWKP